MQTITLTNNFHNTEATLHVSPRETGVFFVSRGQQRRARGKLCPYYDCTCGGTFGQRGGLRLDVLAVHEGGYAVTIHA